MEERTIHERYLRMAIGEASAGMKRGDGGPFGAVIVRDGAILSRAHNTVLSTHDPTAHAEVNAIRMACRSAEHHHLTGAVLYTNFEPCPMCLTAIYWADIRDLFFCAGIEDARRIGFMDSHLYRELAASREARQVRSTRIGLKEMNRLLSDWEGMEGKILY